MHLVTGFFVILCAWKWGDWKNWHKYHITMIYVAMSNLTYNYLYYNHWLWQYKSGILKSHVMADTLTTFIILPLTGLMLLTDYPDTMKGQILRVIKFITIYFLFEVVYSYFGLLIYDYGWNIWWSLAWLCVMFPMIVLHSKKPLIAYGASTIVVILMLIVFPVNSN